MTTTGLFQIAAVATGFGAVGATVQFPSGVPDPTKSAVVGMLAAADGRRKGDSIADLNTLRIGSAVINPGIQHSRFNTVSGARQIDGSQRENPLIRRRTFFQAANQSPTGDWLIRQIIGFQSEDEDFVRHLLKRLVCPVFPVFIGRKNCAPSESLALGMVQGDLFDAFDLIKVKGKATIEVVPTMKIARKTRALDVIENFGNRRMQSRMVVKRSVG